MKTFLITTLGFTLVTSIVFAQEGGGTQALMVDTTQETKPTLIISAESSFTNSYLWRGIECNHGLMLQPSLNFEYNGFTLNIWNNSSILETKGNAVSQEIDYTISDAIETGNFYFEPSILFYTYPSKSNLSVTAEAALFAGYYLGDYGIFINPSSDFLKNVGGVFSETGFTYDHETDKSHVVFNAAYGFGNKKFSEYNIFDGESVTLPSGYQLIDINGYAKKKLNETVYLKPAFNYYRIIGSDFSNFLNTNQWSVTLSVGADF